MLSDAYTEGYQQALADQGLEKEAGVASWLRAGALTLGLGSSGAMIGASQGAKRGVTQALATASEEFYKRKEMGKHVDTDWFIHTNAPDLKRLKPSANDYGAESALDGVYAEYRDGAGIFAGPKADKALLSHEIGHYLQAKKKGYKNKGVDTNSLKHVFSGNKLEDEKDAWRLAREAGLPADQDLEDSAIRVVRAEHDGARRGAAGGGSMGGGLGVMLAALAESMKKKKPKGKAR